MNFDMTYCFSVPTRIIHGFGTTAETGSEAAALKIKKALLVTDRGVKAAGLINDVLASLGRANIPVVVFEEVEEDPSTATVKQGLALLQTAGCNGVVVVGGGSSLCAGKGIGLLATNGGELRDYEGIEKYRLSPLPVIGIPTTAGSGSEVSPTFLINDESRNCKMAITGRSIYPPVAILDPVLLADIPYWPGMNAGMDALSHAVGACCSNLSSPITDSLAIAAIAMIVKNLAPAVLSSDREAKNQQLLASTMANVACGNAKLDLIHALSHPLGSRHMPHGLANGILMPYVMEFNLPVCVDKYAQMAIAMGEMAPGMTVLDLAKMAVARIKELFVVTGYPTKIPAEFATEGDIPALVKESIDKAATKTNRRKATENDLTLIYQKALAGWEGE